MGKTLSALLLFVGAAQAAHADTTRIQALQLLEENRISYEEFHALYGTSVNKSLSNTVTAGNYSDTVTAGNYPDTITSANYPDTVTAGNYPQTITASNYGNIFENSQENVPQPAQK